MLFRIFQWKEINLRYGNRKGEFKVKVLDEVKEEEVQSENGDIFS